MADELIYDSVAENVLEGKLYSSFLGLPGVGTYPPGYPVFISIAYLLSDDKSIVYHTILIINSILTASIIFPAYFLLHRFASRSTAIIGSLVVATLPMLNLFTFFLLSENLFIPLFTYSIWLLVESFERESKLWDIAASVSIAILFITRTQGLSMVIGLTLSLLCMAAVRSSFRMADAVKFTLDKKFLFLPMAALIILWVLYSSYMIPSGTYSFGSPYGVENSYSARLAGSVTDSSVLLTYLDSLVHEIDYLLLSTYFLIMVAIAYFSYAYIKNLKIEWSLNVAIMYFSISAAVLFVITLTFMSITHGIPSYALYGRYIEPLVPVIFIFSFIALERLPGQFISRENAVKALAVFMPAVLFIIYTMPLGPYNLIQTLSVYHLQALGGEMQKHVFIILFSITLFAAFVGSMFYKKSVHIFLLALLCSSLILSSITYDHAVKASAGGYDNNKILKYLEENAGSGSIVLVDQDSFSTNMRYWALTKYWMGDRLVFVGAGNETDIKAYPDAEYVISSSIDMPYEHVMAGWSNLYMINNTAT